jgi:hypothetical protein
VIDGHFVILCNHNRGHSIPLDPMIYAFPFLFDHEFTDHNSPYADGLGMDWNSYCEIQE